MTELTTMQPRKKLELMLGKNEVLVLDSSFRVLNVEHWHNSIQRVVDDRAFTMLDRPERKIRSQYLTFDMPLVVVLNKWVPPKKSDKITLDSIASRRGILQRDSWKCGYCGAKATTIDHIIPKSRGGENTWGNLVSACMPCNNRKADRTPKEAGMITPKLSMGSVENFMSRLQNVIYEVIDGQVSANY